MTGTKELIKSAEAQLLRELIEEFPRHGLLGFKAHLDARLTEASTPEDAPETVLFANSTPLVKLAARYLHEQVAAGAGKFPEFEFDELQEFQDFVESRFTTEESLILHAYDSTNREYARGHRCGVCGNTKAQSLAVGNNCGTDC